MRVVSLVPSLTETLIVAGAEIVGRTRYCVHPKRQIELVPVVGGTKDLSLEKLRKMGPDLLVLDQEENLPWMKADSPCPVHVFHAESVVGMSAQLQALALRFEPGPVREQLGHQAQAWQKAAGHPNLEWNWLRVPGTVKSKRGEAKPPYDKVLYLIWRNPWMSVSSHTFIGSVFEKLGAAPHWPAFSEKYPKLRLEDFDPTSTLLLLSSEPFPFGAKWGQLPELAPYDQVLVDGESFSWFGIRSLRFLSELQARFSHHE
ncbi:MAG: helical backbone metal receptor [Bdellovibrio sp.]|jgi:hypothetical protein